LSTENSTPILGTEESTSILMGRKKSTPKSRKESTPMGRKEYYYNIEEHIKTYKEPQEKLGTENPTSILSHKDPTPILSDDFDYVQDAMDSFVKEQGKKWVF
jgi:hypothetical protein